MLSRPFSSVRGQCHDALSERLAGAMGARHFASHPTHNAPAALALEVPTLPRLVISKSRRCYFAILSFSGELYCNLGVFLESVTGLRISRPHGSRSLGPTPLLPMGKRDTFCQYPLFLSSLLPVLLLPSLA